MKLAPMAHWHEPLKLIGGWRFCPARGSRIRVAFQVDYVRAAPFAGHFLYYEGPEPLHVRTLAADLKSAEIVATAELTTLVQANDDIKPR